MATSNTNRLDSYKEALEGRYAQQEFVNDVCSKLVRRGAAFLAFRPNGVYTVYSNGNQLYTDKSREPMVYRRYLPIIRSRALMKAADMKSNMSEAAWQKESGLSCGFSTVLPEILDNIKRDSSPESAQAASLYRFSPLADGNNSKIILLDVEAAFSSSVKNMSERIDLVLYHTVEKQLVFLEVKRLRDPRLNPNGATPHQIGDQLNRYQSILHTRKAEIVSKYNETIEKYAELSGKTIDAIDENKELLLGLLIVEFGADDLPKIKNELPTTIKYKICSIGAAQNANERTLIKWYNIIK